MSDDSNQELSKSREANWPAVLFLIHVHLLSGYGLWLLFSEVKWMTLIFLVVITMVGILGVTAGAHRLWAHRSYRATTGLRITLMIFQTLAGQGSIYQWVRQHRFHHATFGTDDDPYDYNKGFWYSHVITRMRQLSPHQEKLKSQIDMSDLESDPVVMVQDKLYWVLYAIIFLLLPLNAPLEYWDDSVLSAVFVIGFLRYGLLLHASWLLESATSVWGLKPGEKCPPDTNWVFVLTKSFWPHYHYLVPCDYKSGEYGAYEFDWTTAFIRVCAALDLATDLKTIDSTTVQNALTEATRSKLPVKTCLDEAISKQIPPKEHYLRRG